jgi:plasmid replication initiation protein
MSVSPLPARGGVLWDRRTGDRAVRVAAHPQHGVVTLSVWRADVCVATHQMAAADASRLIAMLANALTDLSAVSALDDQATAS